MNYLLTMMGGLELFDGVFTDILVGNSHVQEGNPLMAPLIAQGSFLPLKIVGFLVCAFLLWRLHRRFPRLAIAATSGIIMFYGAVNIWNLSVFLG